MKKYIVRLLSVLLVVSLVVQIFPSSAFALEAEKVKEQVRLSGESEDAQGSSSDIDPTNIVCEMDAMRGETSKHFRMNDGSFTAIQYNTAVHYAGEDGQWIDIDNTLQPVSIYSGRQNYMATNGEDVTAFSGDLSDGKIFSVYSGSYGIQMQLVDRDEKDGLQTTGGAVSSSSANGVFSRESEAFNRTAVALISGQGQSRSYDNRVSSFIPDKLSSTVLYENVYDGVDLQYDLFGYNVKESIIVKSLQNSYTYHFALQLEGLNPIMKDNGSIALCNEKNEIVYEITAPYMMDSAGEYSEDVYYTLTEVGQNSAIITVTADSTWIAEATLPVTIDPTIVKYIDSISDATSVFQGSTIASGYPNMCYDGDQCLYVGYSGYNNTGEHQIVVHIEGLQGIPNNSIIVAAELNMAYFSFSNDSTSTYSIIQAHEFELDKSANQSYTDWIDNMTWNTAHTGGGSTGNVGDLVDFVKVTAANAGGNVKLDLTKSVRKSRSFNLIFTSDSNANKKIDNVLLEYSNRNYIAVAYQNDVGIEDRFTYQTMSAGRTGSVYISDHTQRLTLVNTLISSDSDILPFSLSLVYNSSQHGEYFGQPGSRSTNLYSANYSKMKIGSGWKLSAQQCIQAISLTGDESGNLYRVYTDADGTEHYFCEDNGVFVDEEGLNLKIESANESGHVNYIMSDEIGNRTFFRDGLLTYYKDVYGNGIYYVYNGASFTAASAESSTSWMPTTGNNNQLTAIYRVVKGGTAEPLVRLTYDTSGFLTKLTDEAGREYVITTAVVTGITYMTDVTYPDGVKAKYFCDTRGLVGTRDTESDLGFRYEYEADGTVKKYSSVHYYNEGANYTTARIISCWNGSGNRSSYRDWGENLIEGSEDDIRLELIFDNSGRTVCQYTTDSEIKEILGTTTLGYTINKGTSKKNNKVESIANAGMTAVNLLKDGSMESDGVWATNLSVGNASVERKARTAFTPRHGEYSLGLTISANASTDSYALTVHSGHPLEKELSYTLSAYVKVPTTGFTWNDGGVLNMVLLDSNQNRIKTVPLLETAPSADIENGWQRVQTTFTVDADGSYKPGFLLQGVTGTVYLDDVQLEQAEAASVYNLVQNGSFEYLTANWTWGVQDTLISYEHTFFGTTLLKGTAVFNGYSRASQTIPMNCSADTTFQLSGWAKGESAPHPSSEFGDNKRFFGLALRIDYTDGTMEFHSVPFEWSNRDWQCSAGNIVPKEKQKTIAQVQVFCAYDNNYGTAYFDNISLRQEPVATYSYNDDGKLIAATQAGNEADGREYEGADLTKYTAPNGVVYEYSYNDKHQAQSVTWDGLKKAYTYNSTTGRLLGAKTQKADNTGTYLQSSSAAMAGDPNHTASTTDVNGRVTQYFYDTTKELVTQVKNANGVATNYDYARNNDRIAITFQSGVAAVYYEYGQGNLSALNRKTFATTGSSTAQWQQYSFTANEWGQRTAVSIKGSETGSTWNNGITLATYAYKQNGGMLEQYTYGNGDGITYEYDKLDRLIKETYNDTGDYILYAYTAEGNIGKLTYKNGTDELLGEYTFEYDSLGRLIRSRERNGAGTVQQTEHLYDTYNRLTSQRWAMGGRTFREVFRYNDPQQGGSGDGSLKAWLTTSNQWVYYNYDHLKRLENTAVKNTSGEDLFTTTYTYKNLSGNRSTMTVESRKMLDSSGGLIAGNQYVYDALGNITEIRRAEGSNNLLYAYAYDSQNQLVREDHYDGNGDQPSNITVSYTYSYDTAGNILSETKTVYSQTGIASTSGKTYAYGNESWQDLLTDVNGSPIIYEGQTYTNGTVGGNVVSGNPIRYTNGTKTYTDLTWEHGRQLTSITTGNKTFTYDYDAEGIRTQKVVDGVVHTYITQNGRVIQESFPYGSSTVIMIFTYDDQGRPFGLWYSTNGGNSYSQYYYAINAQGDVLGIFFTKKNAETNKQETKWMGHYTYDAWGNILSIEDAIGTTPSSPANLMNRNPLRYRGYYYDSETGFYYVSSRYYDPETGRFINADIFVSTGQGILGNNMFAYCNNNPIMYMDPTGCYPLQTACEFLETWLTGDGDEQYYSEGSRIVKQLKKSKKMQSYIDSAIENYKSGRVTTTGYGEFTAVEDGYELYLSTQHFDYTITVTEETRSAGMLWWKHEETRYTVTVTVHDIYNFDTYREWDSFGNTMNNLAYVYHELGGGNDYEWVATYTYSTKWTDAP